MFILCRVTTRVRVLLTLGNDLPIFIPPYELNVNLIVISICVWFTGRHTVCERIAKIHV